MKQISQIAMTKSCNARRTKEKHSDSRVLFFPKQVTFYAWILSSQEFRSRLITKSLNEVSSSDGVIRVALSETGCLPYGGLNPDWWTAILPLCLSSPSVPLMVIFVR